MTGPSTILIVDDEPKNVDYLEQELEGFGYSTISASNGAEALAIVKTAPPALILLDVMMPVMDGFKTCSILKASDETRFIPVIIMTALDAVEDRVRGIKAGADDFLTKPVDERELIARIETSLQLKEAIDRKVTGLRQLSDHLAKFVPSAVRDLVAQNPEEPNLAKQERDASILFLDISGYARLSELLPAPTLSELVEKYFSAFIDEVAERGGNVHETMGDGFMAIFQHPDPKENAASAAETGLGLLAAASRLNQNNQDQEPVCQHSGSPPAERRCQQRNSADKSRVDISNRKRCDYCRDREAENLRVQSIKRPSAKAGPECTPLTGRKLGVPFH